MSKTRASSERALSALPLHTTAQRVLGYFGVLMLAVLCCQVYSIHR